MPSAKTRKTKKKALRLPWLASIVPFRERYQHLFVTVRVTRGLGKIAGIEFRPVTKRLNLRPVWSKSDEIRRQNQKQHGCRERQTGCQKFQRTPERRGRFRPYLLLANFRQHARQKHRARLSGGFPYLADQVTRKA